MEPLALQYPPFFYSNPVYLLDQPLREEARWNLLPEMDNKTRSLIRTELRDWLPGEYKQVRGISSFFILFLPCCCLHLRIP